MRKIIIVCILALATVTTFVNCQATKDYGKQIGSSVTGFGKDVGSSVSDFGKGIGHSFKNAFK